MPVDNSGGRYKKSSWSAPRTKAQSPASPGPEPRDAPAADVECGIAALLWCVVPWLCPAPSVSDRPVCARRREVAHAQERRTPCRHVRSVDLLLALRLGHKCVESPFGCGGSLVLAGPTRRCRCLLRCVSCLVLVLPLERTRFRRRRSCGFGAVVDAATSGSDHALCSFAGLCLYVGDVFRSRNCSSRSGFTCCVGDIFARSTGLKCIHHTREKRDTETTIKFYRKR
jgi:hypothetical protein